jgi:hypothetical protein
MPDVREVGQFPDADGAIVRAGVDHGLVAICCAPQPMRLTPAQREEPGRLLHEADAQAAAWRQENEDSDGG